MCISVYTYCVCTGDHAFCMVSLLWSSSPDHHQHPPLLAPSDIDTGPMFGDAALLARVQGEIL